jgi:hypothetical protein
MKRSTVLLPVLFAFLVGAEPALAWTWPADGPVRQPFTYVGNPYGRGQHRGIDIEAPPGSGVVAPRGGVVTFAGALPGEGRALTISTADGYAVTLLHLASLLVARGDAVQEGDPVGLASDAVESRPHETGLHLGVRIASQPAGYVDPLALLPARGGATASETPASVAEPLLPPGEEAREEPAAGLATSAGTPASGEPDPSSEAESPAPVSQEEAPATAVEEHAPLALPAPPPPPSEPAASSAVAATASPAVVDPAEPAKTVRSHDLPAGLAGDLSRGTTRADAPAALSRSPAGGDGDANLSASRGHRDGRRIGAGVEPGGARLAPPDFPVVQHEAPGGRTEPPSSAEGADRDPNRASWLAGEILVLLGLMAALGGAVMLVVHGRRRATGARAQSVIAPHHLEPSGPGRRGRVALARSGPEVAPPARAARSGVRTGVERPCVPRSDRTSRRPAPALGRSAASSLWELHRSGGERGAWDRERASV